MLRRSLLALIVLAVLPAPAQSAGRTWGATGSSRLATVEGAHAGSIAFQLSGVHGGRGSGHAEIWLPAQTRLAVTCATAEVLGEGWIVRAGGVASDGAAYALEVTTEQGGTMTYGGSVQVERGTPAGCGVGYPAATYHGSDAPEVSIGDGGVEALNGSGTIAIGGADVTVSVDARAVFAQGATGSMTVDRAGEVTEVDVVCTSTKRPAHDPTMAQWWTIVGRAGDGTMYEVFISDAAYRWSTTGDTMAIDVVPFPPPTLSVCSLGGSSRPQALVEGNFVTSDAA